MTKQEFREYLNNRLSILEKKEREDIIEEYLQHIDIKVQSGKTEEEAIRDFGDLNEFTKEILDAYHVKDSYTNRLEHYLDKAAEFLRNLSEQIVYMEGQDIIRIIIEFILLLIVIGIVRWPFYLFMEFLLSLFSFLPWFLYNFIHAISNFMFQLIYLVLSIVTIYTFIKTRIFSKDVSTNKRREYAESKYKEMERYMYQEEEKVNAKVEDTEKFIKETEKQVDEIGGKIDEVAQRIDEKFERKEEKNYKPKKQRETNILANSIVYFLRFLATFILIPVGFISFGLVIIMGMLIGFTVQGIGSIGLSMILLGFTIISIHATTKLGKFVVKGGK